MCNLISSRQVRIQFPGGVGDGGEERRVEGGWDNS